MGGCALGPFIGSKLAGAQAFAVSAATFVGSLLWVSAKFPETLTEEGKKEFDLAACSPLRFLKLFRGRTMSAVAATIGLQSFGDYPNIYDFNFLYMKSVLGYGQGEVGSFATAVGVTQILGGEATRAVIKASGQRTATVVSNALWVMSLSLLGTARSAQQLVLALATMTFGHLRGTPVSAYLQRHGQAAGLGRGEIVSAQMNLTALIKVVAPVLYGQLFSWATTKGRRMPGAPYFLICFLTVVAQLTFWSVDADKEPESSARRPKQVAAAYTRRFTTIMKTAAP